MTRPSSKVQEQLCKALLEMLKSSDLSHEDKEWVRQYASLVIADYASLKANTVEQVQAA